MMLRSILLRAIGAVALAVAVCGTAAQQQAPGPPQKSPPATPGGAAPPAAPAQAAPPANSAPAPIAPRDAPAAAEATSAEIAKTRSALDAATTQPRIAAALPGIVGDIDTRSAETARATKESPSLAELRDLRSAWQKTRDTLTDWQKELSADGARLEQQAAHYDELSKQWAATLSAAREAQAPSDVIARIRQTQSSIQNIHNAIESRHSAYLSTLNQIATQMTRVSSAIALIDAAQKRVVGRLLVQQSAPIWEAAVAAPSAESAAAQGRQSLGEQLDAVSRYAGRARQSIGIHAAVIAAIAAILFAIRRRVHAWAEQVPALSSTEPVFNWPVASALILSVLGTRWIYPQAPHLFVAFVGAAALLATVLILRSIGDRRLVPLLYALLIAYLIDEVRGLLAAEALPGRLVFLTEMAAGVLFSYGVVRSLGPAREPQTPFSRWSRRAARLAIALFTAALAAHALGFTTLADLLERSILGSAYVGFIFYAAVLITDALILLALHARPLRDLRLVQGHRAGIWTLTRRLVRWFAVTWWALIALDRMTLRDPLLAAARSVLDAGIKVGSLNISIGDILAFGLTLWAAFFVSRFVNFVLEEDVLPRSALPRGLPYAITTTTRYLILAVGLLAAVAALGVDMAKFTILIGALTVGVGFGLQNIINNFVSGLILLFERPMKVGDVIQIGDTTGIVQRIGIRATVLVTPAGSQIIIPNGQFISANVTNLTGFHSFRPVQVSVAVIPASDVSRVLDVLPQAAARCAGVVKEPAPRALLTKLGPDALVFDLRVWIDHGEEWARVTNEVMRAVSEALRAANISLK